MPRAKSDSKPRGRMTAYAFFMQRCREEHKKKHPLESVVFVEFSRKCADKWKTMSDQDKQKFQVFADRDKKRYELELEDYIPPKGGSVKMKRRLKKDPNAPKRSLSAFFWFCKEERSKVKEMNPEYGVGEIAKQLGRSWHDASPEVKTKYQALSTADRARYEKEMAVYKTQTEAALAHDGDDEDEGDEEDENE